MKKTIRIDYYNTHENIESYFGEILTEYRKMLRACWDKQYTIILYDKDTGTEWKLEFTNDLEYKLTQIQNGA